MKSKRYKNVGDLAEDLNLSRERGKLAEMKAKLSAEIFMVVKKKGLTHQQVADLSGVPRSAITGIINSSLQKVTLDRLIRVLNALGKSIELKIKNVA